MSTFSQILTIYHPKTWNRQMDRQDIDAMINVDPGIKRRVSRKVPAMHDSNHASGEWPTPFRKRDLELSYNWSLSQISTPQSYNWLTDGNIQEQVSVNGVALQQYKYYFHSSEGFGQYIYIVEDGIWANHPVN